MIGTLLRIGWLQTRRDRPALLLSFVLPVLFFSIFAVIFGGMSGTGTSRVRVAVVNEDGSEFSKRLVAALQKEKGLEVRTTAVPRGAPEGSPAVPLTRDRAKDLVRDGNVPVAVVIPAGIASTFPSFGGQGESILLLSDTSDPVAPQIVNGLLQKSVFTAAPDLLARNGIGQFEKYAGGLTPQQRTAVDAWLPRIEEWTRRGGKAAGAGTAPGGTAQDSESMGLVPVRIVDVLGENRKGGAVSYYAAGTAVMFLLFTCSGAGGALLEESESGTLDRVLSSRLGMGRLLAGKWLFLTILGVIQVALMFVWGALLFGVELLRHLPGFVLMTLATSAAAAGFGLVLATACRSRRQLAGLSTAVILVMSAIGGSMFPRFLMGPSLRKLGYFTFNAWALDGYLKVFWRDAPLVSLWPQLLVLVVLAAVFLLAARRLARRWETI